LFDDHALADDIDRVAAAVGLPVVHAADPSGRNARTGAVAVLLDVTAARRCADRALPRRGRVVLVARAEPEAADFQAADSCRGEDRRREVVAVIAGRGGAGTSVFATALAQTADDALLVDADPWGGGVDLVLGCEGQTVCGCRTSRCNAAG
jgi:hypothetical protein